MTTNQTQLAGVRYQAVLLLEVALMELHKVTPDLDRAWETVDRALDHVGTCRILEAAIARDVMGAHHG